MEIEIKRIAKRATYTIGRLYVNGEYFCDTCEDTDRGLNTAQTDKEIASRKVYGETAIPTGRYEVAWTWSPKFKRNLPEVLRVPGFSGIRIHSGNTAADSLGCPLLGENKEVGKVLNSRVTCERFYKVIRETIKREKIWLTIK